MADIPTNFQSDPNMKGLDITEEEAEALDKLWTETTPKVKANGTGFVSWREARLMGFDTLTMNYLTTKEGAKVSVTKFAVYQNGLKSALLMFFSAGTRLSPQICQ